MMIENDSVVTLHYQLFDSTDDTLIEDSRDDQPMAYLHGHGNIVAGLEQALAGKEAGESLTVTLAPAQAYGDYKPDLHQRLSRKYVKHAGKLLPGKPITLNTREGPRRVTVIKAGLKTVDIDANHPLAGKHLRFQVDIITVREASDEEKAHKHAHGVGGHQH